MKIITPIIMSLSIFITSTAAAEPNYQQIFANTVNPCFTMLDLETQKTVASFNSKSCDNRLPPCSTFKVPISLMGFDSGILTDENNPEWKYKSEYPATIEAWKHDQTPKSWIANSVVWYSQILTLKLGMEKFKDYVTKFNYGNMDISGNAGKNDGLTESWLNSSLKISSNEQIEFLKKLVNDQLPVSKRASLLTKNIMFIEELDGGWKLYGKTGSTWEKNEKGEKIENLWLGRFVGYIEKAGQIYVFAINFNDKNVTKEAGGPRAKAMAKEIFANLDILK